MNHLNELIALELGWRDLSPAMDNIGRGQSTGIPPGELRTYVPNWAGDLNLMQGLVDAFNDKEKDLFGWALLEVMDGEFPTYFDDNNRFTISAENICEISSATAEQKALAWLKVKGVTV